ncbi:MAG: glycosyltransferase family 9 protein [Ferruginibacter sp.]
MRVLENIIISRTDSIGDIVMAMPVATVLKKQFPGIKIAVLGKAYTRDMAMACENVDQFITVEEFMQTDILIDGNKPKAMLHLTTESEVAKRALKLNIPIRIGTSRRLFHLWTCNRFVWLNRKNSGLHETQLNLKLLQPIGIKVTLSLENIGRSYGLTRLEELTGPNKSFLSNDKYNLIIHAKSRGSSREWPLQNFIKLINSLDEGSYNIILSGVKEEIPFINEIVKNINKPVNVIAGQIGLKQFIPFVKAADAVLSNSTGPVHIAAALGKDVIGIYPPLRSKEPARWGPVGPKAKVFVLDKSCIDCKLTPDHCSCINAIEPISIKIALDKLMEEKRKVLPGHS